MSPGEPHLRPEPNGVNGILRRRRVLLCACTSQDATWALELLRGAETVYLPTDNLDEVRKEGRQFHPDLVICRMNFFLSVLSDARSRRSGAQFQEPTGASRIGKGQKPSAAELSERHRDVLALLAKGFKNPEIAGHLHLSERSIKRAFQELYEKFEVTNRTELVGLAAEMKFFEGDPQKVG